MPACARRPYAERRGCRRGGTPTRNSSRERARHRVPRRARRLAVAVWPRPGPRSLRCPLRRESSPERRVAATLGGPQCRCSTRGPADMGGSDRPQDPTFQVASGLDHCSADKQRQKTTSGSQRMQPGRSVATPSWNSAVCVLSSSGARSVEQAPEHNSHELSQRPLACQARALRAVPARVTFVRLGRKRPRTSCDVATWRCPDPKARP